MKAVEPKNGPRTPHRKNQFEPEAALAASSSDNTSGFRYIDLVSRGAETTVRLLGHRPIREDQVEEFIEECCTAASHATCKSLVVDCSEISLMRSEMMGWLILLQRRIIDKGSSLALSGLRPEVRDVFKWTKLDRFFEIKEDIAKTTAEQHEFHS